MKKVKDILSTLFEVLKGKKSYLIGVCALVFGFYQNDKEIIFIGLGLLGLRHGVTNESMKLLKRLTGEVEE